MDELSNRTRRTCRAGGLCGRAALFAGGVALGAVEDGSLVEVARGAAGDAGVVVELFWLRGGAGTAGAARGVEAGRAVRVAGDALAGAVVVGRAESRTVYSADSRRQLSVPACRTLHAVELGRPGAGGAVRVALEAGVVHLVVACVAVDARVAGVCSAGFAREVARSTLVGERSDEQRV